MELNADIKVNCGNNISNSMFGIMFTGAFCADILTVDKGIDVDK